MQVGAIRKAKNELIANQRQECSMLVIVATLRRLVQGLSRIRRLSSRLFSSHVLSVMLLLRRSVQVGAKEARAEARAEELKLELKMQ